MILLACSVTGSCLDTFLTQPRPACLEIELELTQRLDHSASVTSQGNLSQTWMAVGQSDGDTSSVEIPSSQVSLGCDKLTALAALLEVPSSSAANHMVAHNHL